MCYLSQLVWLFSGAQKCLADVHPNTKDHNNVDLIKCGKISDLYIVSKYKYLWEKYIL